MRICVNGPAIDEEADWRAYRAREQELQARFGGNVFPGERGLINDKPSAGTNGKHGYDHANAEADEDEARLGLVKTVLSGKNERQSCKEQVKVSVL